MTTALADLADAIKLAGRIGPDDVLAMRRQVYGQPAIDADQVDALVALDGAVPDRDPAWGEFFAEALVDYVVRQQDPEDYVDAAKADWLMRALGGDLKPDSAIEALVRIIETAAGAPPALAAFALDRLKAYVIGAHRLGQAEIGLLRRLVFAGGGDGAVGVTRAEADALFDINEACGSDYAPEWPDFFAKAVADAVTAVSPFQVEDREAALRDEMWLKSRESVATFGKRMVRPPDVAGAIKDVLDPFAGEADEWRAPEAAMEAAAAAAAPISNEEARWLIGRLGSGPLGEPERRLVLLLRELAPQSGGVLQPLFKAVEARPDAA